MDVIYFLIPISIIIGLALVGLLIVSIKNNQFEDLKGEGERILFDE
jgi:cbb3-type cytochrome oxidase maturation protein